LRSTPDWSKIGRTEKDRGARMPHSWVRVSSRTSRKIQRCRNTTRAEFEECVKGIVIEDGGVFEALDWEANGRWARVRFTWEGHAQKDKIIFDLEGDDVIDLLTLAEVNLLEEADTPYED
jgi:hypothetical protein